MADLTPETALAMATTARGVVADAEQVKRLWSNACGGLREMEEAWARDTLAVLDALGFEVRRKEATDPQSEALRRRPDQECR